MTLATKLALVPVVLAGLIGLLALAYLGLVAWCVSGDAANTPEEEL